MSTSWHSDSPKRRPTGTEPTFCARARRRRRPARGVAIAVNIAPMVDMTFLLLIFFLVTTTFERAEGVLSSRLPDDSRVPTVALPISPVVVRLTQTDLGYEDYEIGVDRFDDAPRSFAELAGFLRQIQDIPGFDEQTPVVIVAENDVRWDHVVDCWNAALRAGYEKVAFAEP